MLLPKILAVQCELRFQPFFSGEPHFHQTASYLVENDFELIDLKPEFWKPATAHQKEHRDGRVVWANCLFVRKPELVSDPVSQAKQIIIASMLNRRCYAEYLCERYQSTLPAEWKAELEQLVVPVKTFRDSGIWKILRCIRDVVSPRPTMEHVAEY
jgi:hypothetical protein